MRTTKQVFILNGLDCQNCAEKIETEVAQLPYVTHSEVNFLTSKLTIETSKTTKAFEDIKKAVNRIEPHIRIKEVNENQKKDPESHNTHSKTKQMIIRLVLASLVTLFAVLADYTPAVKLSLFIFSYITIGGDIVWRAVKNISRLGNVFDEHFLMSIATIGAFIVGEYPEAIAVMIFYQVGELFQGLAVNRSRQSIHKLMDIRPEYAHQMIDGNLKKVKPEQVKVNETIVIKPGEKVPLDGMIIDGFSTLDTSALTGESIPKDVKQGDEVLSGFINLNGVLTVNVTKLYSESTVKKILDLVENSNSKKAPTEKFITKFARYYTPIVVGIALLLAVLPPLVIADALFSDWVYRALIFLVISCPCALVVSIPLGFFGGVGGAARQGVLVKGANYLEGLNHVQHVVFDKTGTLTKGSFEVTEIQPADNFTQDQLLEYAAFAEVHSNHPIATSIIKAYGKSVSKANVSHYEEIHGQGVIVEFNGDTIHVGNKKMMQQANIAFTHSNKSGTCVHVAVNQDYIGYIVISDQIKHDAKEAINQLKALGIKQTIMLTGDSETVANEVSHKLGIDAYYAELLPHEKVEKLEMIAKGKDKHEKLLFVGDGINDTPVLAQSDIGVAMGGLGSDAAIEAADVVIMNDEPSKLATAIKKANYTKKIVWQNIILALGVKSIVLILGAFGLATMWAAIISDVGVTVIAVLNAMRVLKK